MIRTCMKLAAIVLSMLCILPAPLTAQTASGAKEMFDDGSESPVLANAERPAPAKPKPPRPPLGLKFWIELLEPGQPGKRVTHERVFQSGEKIRLHFEGNRTGRIAILQIGSSGSSSVLFPDSAKGLGDNTIRGGADHVLPSADHWFRFDDSAGTEKLMVLFAKDQASLDRAIPARLMDEAETERLLESTTRGAKDLVIETVKSEGTYAVTRDGGLVVMEITLRHR